MRVLFDGRVLEGATSGVRDIAAGLVAGLRRLETRGGVQLLVASDRKSSEVADIYVPFRGYIHGGLPFAAIRFSADCILIPRQTVPLYSGVRAIPLFHDIGFIRRPDLYPKSKRIALTTRIAARQSRGLTVSTYTAREMNQARLGRRLTALPIQAVHSLHWAPDENDKYVLCVAAQEPHKNLVRLIDAWNQAETQGARLVLCGRAGLDTPELLNRLERSGKTITVCSNLADHEYSDLLRRCWGYVQPSFYEGLCIPAMDLAAAGVPLVVSNESNLGAVFDGAPPGQLFNPSCELEIASALTRLVHDSDFRKVISEFGSSKVRMTDWEMVASLALDGMG